MLYSQALSLLRRRGESFTHHTLTHEEPIDASLGYQREVAKLHLTSMKALASFIQAFKDIREGDGTLLDNTLIFANLGYWKLTRSLGRQHSGDDDWQSWWSTKNRHAYYG